jgi:aminoglycoside phosphotransferase (APT) family kinase protein
VARQFPQWAELPVRPVALSGWDNHTFHLGSAMKIRLPSAERYVAQVVKENRFLPLLAPQLPLPIPAPLAVGHPDAEFPWPWSVSSWISGETLTRGRIDSSERFARDLAAFLTALWRADTNGGPPAGVQNFHRGGDLAVYDAETRASIAALGDRIDSSAALSVWATALTSRWTQPPVWMHGDVAVGNLLVQNGKLNAVIDFGQCGLGDPACDLVLAWTFFDEAGRAAFRSALPADHTLWARARGWALWKALLMATQNQRTNQGERTPLDVVRLVTGEI